MGCNWRPKFDPKIAHRELGIIKDDLDSPNLGLCTVRFQYALHAGGTFPVMPSQASIEIWS